MLAALFLAACTSNDSLAVPVPHLHAPLAVQRLDVLTGAVNVVPVRISNSGTGDASAAVEVTEPFLVPGAAYRIGPDEEIVVPIVVRPTDYAPLDGTLALSTGYQTLSVALHIEPAVDWDGDGFLAVGAGGDDCDDTLVATAPGVGEVCDGIDQDCDGAIDDGAADALAWFADVDDDGHGDAAARVDACEAPDGTSPSSDDCDDADDAVHPGAAEVIPDVDDDCDGRVDENLVVAQDLLFVELHAVPSAVDSTVGQFAELVNRSTRDIDVGGFRVGGSVDSLVLAPRRLAPGEVLLLCGSLDASVNGGMDACDDRLPVLQPNDRITVSADSSVDAVDFRGWNLPAGRAIALTASARALGRNDALGDWCVQGTTYGDGDFGTPGALVDCP